MTEPITERSTGSMDESTGAGKVEHDSMGDVVVPSGAKWQAQTQRAIVNFPVSGEPVPPLVIEWLAHIKATAAAVNADLGVAGIDQAMADAIVAGATQVVEGRHVDQFPIDVFQTGSGTSTNMNVNEVLATLATEQLAAHGDRRQVHPNDHVNASQSSNDVFPSAVRIAAAQLVTVELVPALAHLAGVLRERADAERDTVKAGRTHLMDATPVTLGQELGGYARAVELGIQRLEATLGRLGELPLGGTAVGTGTNCPPGFPSAVIARLAAISGLPLVEAADHFEAQGGQDVLVEVSGAARVVAVSLNKIAEDLRWMASGPSAGLAELQLPALQPGSSIMPGKVNPVIPEVVVQVVAQVIGNDATVAWAGAAGHFELNTMLPVIARNLLESLRLLSSAARLLADRCVAGITADRERMLDYARASSAIVTALNPLVGYERAAALAKEAQERRVSIVAVLAEHGIMTVEQAEEALDVLSLTRRPG